MLLSNGVMSWFLSRMRGTRSRLRAAAFCAFCMVGVLGALGSAAHSEPLRPEAGVDTAELMSQGSGPVRTAPRWQWPSMPVRLIRPFTAPATRYAAGHRGVDLGVEPGAPLLAPADGVVRFAGVVVERPVLTLEHSGGVLSSYEPVDLAPEVGTVVSRGQPIGVLGSGGHCVHCLHVGVRVDGEYVSPLLFFDRVPPAVLLPLGRR